MCTPVQQLLIMIRRVVEYCGSRWCVWACMCLCLFVLASVGQRAVSGVIHSFVLFMFICVIVAYIEYYISLIFIFLFGYCGPLA